jgi:hypothetical protein
MLNDTHMHAANKKDTNKEIIVVRKMRDYSNEPLFQKKAEKAASFLKKHGLPKAFAKNQK